MGDRSRLVAALVFVVAVAPLVLGFPAGHDWPFELARAREFGAALAAGQFPPHYGENLYAGFGAPAFLFYAPLFSAGTVALAPLAGSFERAAAWLLVAFSALGFALARAWLETLLESLGRPNRAAARIGAAFFALHPYLLGDKLLRNADAEFAALMLLPLLLRGVALAGTRPRAAFLSISAGLALVVLAHNLTALVALPLLIGAALLSARFGRREWAVLGAGVGAGLLLSLWFWLPALAYTDWVRPEELVSGKFDFRRQFPALLDVFGYTRFFATGLATPLAWLAAAAAFVRAPDLRRPLALALVGAAALLFLVTRASTPLWESLPFLPLFQFPWRWLGPLALVCAALVALALCTRPPSFALEVALCAALAANALPLLLQYRPLPDDAKRALADGTLPARITVLDEYLPRGVQPGVWEARPARDGAAIGSLRALRVTWRRETGSSLAFETHADAPDELELARFAQPGWRARVNGAEVAPSATRYGTLALAIPADDASIEVWLEPPPLRRLGLAVSGLALAAWLGWLAVAMRSARVST